MDQEVRMKARRLRLARFLALLFPRPQSAFLRVFFMTLGLNSL